MIPLLRLKRRCVNKMTDEDREEGIAYLKLDDVATPEEWELMKNATKDLGQFLVELGHQIRLDRGDSDV